MLTGRYMKNGEIELEGDFAGLLELAKVLSGEGGPEEIILTKTDPTPYEASLESVRVEKDVFGGKPLLIHQAEHKLLLWGSSEKLRLLAENIRFLVAQGADPHSSIQNHIHIEYYDNHPYLHHDSVSLTISFMASEDK